MKFRSITLSNFMRYKGETTLNFSCDEKQNVTVVLGDNTFGKTTLAQAFRWGLFEELASTNYARKGEIVLLNYDVIGTMSLSTNQRVMVKIAVEDGEDVIMFQRSAIFRRKSLEPGNMSIAQVGDTSLVMQITRNGVTGLVGGAAGKFKELLEGWEYDTAEILEILDRKQDDFDDAFDDKARASMERDSLSRKMNKNVDVKALRRAVEEARKECRTQDSRLGQIRGEIKNIRQEIASKTQQMETLASKNEYNEKIKRAIAYTDEIYNTACRYADRAREHILEDLNEIISRNFNTMFQDTEKYAKLEEDYKVHVYYRATDVEETVLSNGEATAVNFVYIVSILELARQRAEAEKQEAAEDDIGSGILHLPLVLDGPFSALSNGNTNLVAKKLPNFAEQVIIFMMDKDWEASGLDAFTRDGFSYHIVKEDKALSSTIEQKGGVD